MTLLIEDEAIEVVMTQSRYQFILDETFVDKEIFGEGIPQGKKIIFRLTGADMDEIMGHIAAAANHCENMRKKERLDKLYDYFENF